MQADQILYGGMSCIYIQIFLWSVGVC